MPLLRKLFWDILPRKTKKQIKRICRTQAQTIRMLAGVLQHWSIISSGSNQEEQYNEGKGIKGQQCQLAYIVSVTDWNSRSDRSKRRLSGEGVSMKAKVGLVDYVIQSQDRRVHSRPSILQLGYIQQLCTSTSSYVQLG